MDDLVKQIKTLEIKEGTVLVFKGEDMDLNTIQKVSKMLNGFYPFKVPILVLQDGDVNVENLDDAIDMLNEIKKELKND
jgi:hypothetical protein